MVNLGTLSRRGGGQRWLCAYQRRSSGSLRRRERDQEKKWLRALVLVAPSSCHRM